MKFIVPGVNVKHLGKAIHCLAKIGDEVYLDSESDALILRTVNISRSAFASFSFGSSFFSSIEASADKSSSEDDGKCKVMIRSLLLAFRSLSCLEKTIESAALEIDSENCKLLINFSCRHNVSKSFSLGLLECDNLKAVYDINKCQNKWVIDSKVMQEAYGNFLANQEEVTMYVSKENIKIKKYIDDIDEKKQIHTEVSMQPREFEVFDINEETSVTFCLKEFRSLLIFAEYLNLPITARFSSGGLPLVLVMSQGEFLTSTYVLATLAEDGSSQPAARTPQSCSTLQRAAVNQGQTSEKATNVFHSTQRETPAQDPSQAICTPDLSTIPPPSLLQNNFVNSLNINEENGDNNDNNQECFDASPPSKKKNFLFRRCFDATWNPNKIAGTEKVLAPDSDEET